MRKSRELTKSPSSLKRRKEEKKSDIERKIEMATTQEEQQNEAGRHQEVGHKSLLQSDALYQVHKHNPNSTLLFYSIIKLYLFKKKKKNYCSLQYILETSVYPKEPEPMKELRELTARHPW